VAERPIDEDILMLFDLVVDWFCMILMIVTGKFRQLTLKVVGLESGREVET
jgi:hypothetical protein